MKRLMWFFKITIDDFFLLLVILNCFLMLLFDGASCSNGVNIFFRGLSGGISFNGYRISYTHFFRVCKRSLSIIWDPLIRMSWSYKNNMNNF